MKLPTKELVEIGEALQALGFPTVTVAPTRTMIWQELVAPEAFGTHLSKLSADGPKAFVYLAENYQNGEWQKDLRIGLAKDGRLESLTLPELLDRAGLDRFTMATYRAAIQSRTADL